MFNSDFWEVASYVVTVIGLPVATCIYFFEQRKERANEEAEVYQLLANAYTDFLKVVLDHPDLHLFSNRATPDLTAEQRERMLVVFDMLMSLFERAYLTAWQPRMNGAQTRVAPTDQHGFGRWQAVAAASRGRSSVHRGELVKHPG
jgi:hypothetical protein